MLICHNRVDISLFPLCIHLIYHDIPFTFHILKMGILYQIIQVTNIETHSLGPQPPGTRAFLAIPHPRNGGAGPTHYQASSVLVNKFAKHHFAWLHHQKTRFQQQTANICEKWQFTLQKWWFTRNMWGLKASKVRFWPSNNGSSSYWTVTIP